MKKRAPVSHQSPNEHFPPSTKRADKTSFTPGSNTSPQVMYRYPTIQNSTDILALQRSVGNRVTQRLIKKQHTVQRMVLPSNLTGTEEVNTDIDFDNFVNKYIMYLQDKNFTFTEIIERLEKIQSFIYNQSSVGVAQRTPDEQIAIDVLTSWITNLKGSWTKELDDRPNPEESKEQLPGDPPEPWKTYPKVKKTYSKKGK